MPDHSYASTGTALRIIHGCITRGLDLCIQNSRKFAQAGFPDEGTRRGFIDYAGSLVAVLTAHHTGEDELAFPYFMQRFPEAPFGMLSANHEQMHPLLEQAAKELAGLEQNPQPGEGLLRLNQILTELEDLWRPHIQVEETHFSPEATAERMTQAENHQLETELGQHSAQHAGPDYLTVPFTLLNIPLPEREIIAGLMPPVVTEQLVPLVWKEKWQPMAQFLLV